MPGTLTPENVEQRRHVAADVDEAPLTDAREVWCLVPTRPM